jgi:hypothetical protein
MESGAFLTPGSRMGEKSGSGMKIQDKVFFKELRNWFELKILNFFDGDADPGSFLLWIRDPGWKTSVRDPV